MKPEKPWLIALFVGAIAAIVSLVAACSGKAKRTPDGDGDISFMLVSSILVGGLAVCVIGFTAVVLSSRSSILCQGAIGQESIFNSPIVTWKKFINE